MRYSRFTFVENTISNSPNVPSAKFLESDGLFCFSIICKFGSFSNPFATITSLSELYFRFRRFILWTIAASQAAENHGDEWGLTWYLRWGIYIYIYTHTNSNLNPLTKFTSNSRSTEFKGILPWNISQIIMKIVPISTRIVINHTIKQGIWFWVY